MLKQAFEKSKKYTTTAFAAYGTVRATLNNPILKYLVDTHLTETVPIGKQYDYETATKIVEKLLECKVLTVKGTPGQYQRMAGSTAWLSNVDGVPILVQFSENPMASAAVTTASYLRPHRRKFADLVDDVLGPNKDQPYIYDATSNTSVLNSRIDHRYNDAIQYVSEEDYDVIDSLFARMSSGREWYDKNEKYFRETILISGPPGTGKTNLIRHMAAKYKTNMYQVNTLPPNMDVRSDDLRIILIEDVCRIPMFNDYPEPEVAEDNVATQRFNRALSPGYGAYNFSNVINYLDGPVPLDNVIVIMTANNPQHLKKALTREGRIDTNLRLGYLKFDLFCDRVGWDVECDLAQHFKKVLGHENYTAGLVSIMRRCKTTDAIDYQLNQLILKHEEAETGVTY